MTTESRTFVGLDGFAGFRRDQVYVLCFERLEDSQVSIKLNHAQEGVGPLVVSGAQGDEMVMIIV